MSLKNIYLFGYSGHALVVHDSLDKSEFEVAGYFDTKENSENPLYIQYKGNENQVNLNEIIQDGYAFPCIGSNSARQKIVAEFRSKGLNELVIKHPTSYVSNSSVIGASTLIGPKAVVNPKVIIGEGVIINTSAIVEHECQIGNYAHICPGTVLAGNVMIGSCAFIGANSTVKQGISIGNNAVVGAGSVVLEDIQENEMWAGVPAKKIKNIEQ